MQNFLDERREFGIVLKNANLWFLLKKVENFGVKFEKFGFLLKVVLDLSFYIEICSRGLLESKTKKTDGETDSRRRNHTLSYS